jgi:hypothetical protein
MKEQDKIDALVRHIDHVRDNCMLLGQRLIDKNVDIGRLLIANGFIHDNSKFYGIEWDYLIDATDDKELMRAAIRQHNTTNPHHPEYWGTIDMMPDVYLAEAVCDWGARATEFRSSLHEWITKEASTRFDYTLDSEIFKKIQFYTSLLCEKPFKIL